MNINLILTRDEAQTLLNILGDVPFRISAPLIGRLQQAAAAATATQQAPVSDTLDDPFPPNPVALQRAPTGNGLDHGG